MKYIVLLFYVFLFTFCNESSKKKFSYVNEVEISKRADSFYQIDQYENAKMCFDTLVFYNSSTSKYYFKRGYCKCMLQNDNRSAILDFFQAINYGYKNPASAYVNIGTLFRIEGEYDSAVIYYDKALKMDPNNEKAKQDREEILGLLKKKR